MEVRIAPVCLSVYPSELCLPFIRNEKVRSSSPSAQNLDSNTGKTKVAHITTGETDLRSKEIMVIKPLNADMPHFSEEGPHELQI